MTTIAYSPSRLGFWRAFVTTTRPYLGFVSATSGLVGLALAGGRSRSATSFWLALGVLFLVYGFGQAATDVFQTDTDAISAPYRPLVRSVVRPRDVLVVALLGLAGAAAVLAVLNREVLVLALLGVAGLLAYTPMKRRFWAGPAHNAWVVALLPPIGAMCAGSSLREALSSPRVLLAMASTFLSYAVFVVLGYLKDVEADRVTGYDTVAVRFGRRAATLASAVLAVASLVPSALLAAPAFVRLGGIVWGAGAVLLLLAHAGMLGVDRDAGAHPWVAMSVRAFVLLRLGEALAYDPSFAYGAIAILVLFEWSLAARPERTQI